VRLLVDSHALLWFDEGNERLGVKAQAMMSDPGNELLLSVAIIWEIAIKVSLGKLRLLESFGAYIQRVIHENNIMNLPLSLDHANMLITLPFHHRDPFDRLLIAQAIVENLPILSADNRFDKYPITRLW
jgi:PIN domain nuclease of toxin-antitoxin system